MFVVTDSFFLGGCLVSLFLRCRTFGLWAIPLWAWFVVTDSFLLGRCFCVTILLVSGRVFCEHALSLPTLSGRTFLLYSLRYRAFGLWATPLWAFVVVTVSFWEVVLLDLLLTALFQ